MKKLQGTYRNDRDSNRAEVIISDLITPASSVPVPVEIKDEYVKHYFTTHVQFLEKLSLLQNSDIPHLTQMFILLQQLREVNKKVEEIQIKGILDNLETYEQLVKLMLRLTEKYDKLAGTYYITPLSRTKLTLDSLNIKKLEQENPSLTAKRLQKKRA